MSSSLARPSASDELALILVALLRTDGHLNNVLTHISRGDWDAVEKAIAVIVDWNTRAKDLSKLARNILELVCDDAGQTGRRMRPFFIGSIARFSGQEESERLERQIRRLRHDLAPSDLRPSPETRAREIVAESAV
jgi:hypothetical protein